MTATRGLAHATAESLHILVLADRDWTHPQGGGSGANLEAQVTHWIEWGHRVTVVACGYPGAVRHEQFGNLTIHRLGGRTTVFPRACWKQWRGLVPDADVVLEIFNGVSFLTPAWVRTPRVTLIHHVHRDHYVAEMGPKGRIAAAVLETLPLRTLYRRSHFVTMSQSSASQIAANGVPDDRICINTPGLDLSAYEPGEKATEPTLLYLGRLKRYKRPELLLDVVEAIPGVVLDVAGDGDHRQVLQAEVRRRGLGDRVRVLGHVDDETKLRLLQRAWVHVTPSSNEGWGLTVVEAAACGTPTVASANGGLRESVVDGRTGILADDVPGLIEATRRLVEDDDLRREMGVNARQRAEELSWARHAKLTIDELVAARERSDAALAARRPGTKAIAGGVAATNAVALPLAAALLSAHDLIGMLVVQLVFLAAFALLLRREVAPPHAVSDTSA